jgi:transmembrane sensor
MKPYDQSDQTDQMAAQWMLRHDRGLTGAEQDEFSQWLASDPANRAAWAEHRWAWEEMDRLVGLQTTVAAVPDPDLLAPRRRYWNRAVVVRWVAPAMALAAVLAVAFILGTTRPEPGPAAPAAPWGLALIEQRTLSDGSVVALNRGAELREVFTAHERALLLTRGEAHFEVARDESRPFVVQAGEVTVRALGTAFNVRLDSASVEVLVTAGLVDVQRTPPSAVDHPVEPAIPLHLKAGERTVVSLAPTAPAPQVAVVAPAEIEAKLAWQPRLLDFTAAPLAEIVAEFNRRNPVRLVLADPDLAAMALSATFRSDNVEGFVRLMEANFGLAADWQSADEILLRRAR